MATISLCLIVKNEEHNLPRLLDSVSGIYDELVVVDTGSTDRTKKVAGMYGAKIFDFEWIDDFAAARNFAFSKATCDYWFWLDADDVVKTEEREKILALKRELSADIYFMQYDYCQDALGRSIAMLPRERIVKRGVTRWEGPIHECMPTPAHLKMVKTDIVITHQRSGADAGRDLGRNIRILEKAVAKDPNNQRMRYYYAKELSTSSDRHADAVKQFELYFSRPDGNHNQINGRMYMANSLLMLGREDDAANCCLEGIKLDPRFAEFYNTIGDFYYRKKDWPRATHWFEQASRLPIPDFDGTVIREHYEWIPADRLCMCYSQTGRMLEAYEQNEKALSFRPDDPRLLHNRQFMRDHPAVKGRTSKPVPKLQEIVSKPENKQLTVICCAMGGNIANADFLRPITERLGMKFVTISEWIGKHDIVWKQDTWLKELSKADIIVCPQRHEIQPAKSNNRVTQAQSLGIPVIASPLQAYKEAIVDHETGFICNTEAEWERALVFLKDPKNRQYIGQAGKASAAKYYSIDTVGSHWVKMLDDLCREACNPPACDIIIPTWNNLKLLQECIKSIRINTDWPCNIIVVNSGTDGTAEWIAHYNPDILCFNSGERLHFSAANNIGLERAKSEFVCFLNDDTIVAKHWLSALMHEAMKPGVGGVNPFSNCDLNWLHHEVVTIDGISLYPGMNYDNVEAIIPKLYEQKHDKVVTPREWLAMYCTVMPRKALDMLGAKPFDENFRSGCEDKDLCLRLAKHGYRFVTTFDSFVFHFGGSTRKNAVKFDKETHEREDRENNEYLVKKHTVGATQPQSAVTDEQMSAALRNHCKVSYEQTQKLQAKKKRVVIYTGQAWEPWNPDSINLGGIGGSETCAIHVANEFSRRGYETIVFGDCGKHSEVRQNISKGMFNGVEYRDYTEFDVFIREQRGVDIFISSRRPDIFAAPIKARRKFLWVHDIFASSDRNANLYLDVIDKILVLSPWHKDFFLSFHAGVPPEKLFVTRNGIDASRFSRHVDRVPGKLIYTSSPDRGLDVLLDMFPRIKKNIPELTLTCAYGFANWEKAVKMRRNPAEIAWMERIKQQLNQPGVTMLGRIGQDRLAKEFMSSMLFAYPCHFDETSCLSAMEAMEAGTPILSTARAALTTTVGDAGILLPGDSRSEAYQGNFVNAATAILLDKNLWSQLSERGRQRVKVNRWPEIVDEWESL